MSGDGVIDRAERMRKSCKQVHSFGRLEEKENLKESGRNIV